MTVIDYIMSQKGPGYPGRYAIEEELTRSVSGWKSYVRDSSNWQLIEDLPLWNGFRELMLEECKVPLAERWLQSKNSDLRKEAEYWLRGNWMAHWDELSDLAKRRVAELLHEANIRLSGKAEAIEEIVRSVRELLRK